MVKAYMCCEWIMLQEKEKKNKNTSKQIKRTTSQSIETKKKQTNQKTKQK